MITPEDLIGDINYARTIEDKRLMFLYFDLYIEHFIHTMYGEIKHKIKHKKTFLKSIINFFCKKSISVASPKTKTNILIKHKFIDEMFSDIILLIFNLRHELIHNLKPNIKMIEKKINQHKPPIEDKLGLVKKFLDKASSWDKIQLYAIPTIVHLYQRLKKIRNEKIDYDMRFEINPEASWVQIVLLKKS